MESGSCRRLKGGHLLLKLDRRSVVVEARSSDLTGGACPIVEAHLGSGVDIRSRPPAVEIQSGLLAVEIRLSQELGWNPKGGRPS